MVHLMNSNAPFKGHSPASPPKRVLGLLARQFLQPDKERLSINKLDLRWHERLQKNVILEFRSKIRGGGEESLGRLVSLQYAQKSAHVVSADQVTGPVAFT